MKVQFKTQNTGQTIEAENVKRLKVIIGDKEFRLSVDNMGNLIVNKIDSESGSHAISIQPSCGNEIKIK